MALISSLLNSYGILIIIKNVRNINFFNKILLSGIFTGVNTINYIENSKDPKFDNLKETVHKIDLELENKISRFIDEIKESV